MGTPSLTPARRGGLTPPRTSSSGGGSGGGLAHFDRALIALCLLASLALLYRCLAMPASVLPLGAGGTAAGAATVIATVRGGGSVEAQLLVGSGGRLAAAAAATSPRSRRATLRGAAAARQAQLGGGREGGPAGEVLPGLPPDFDAQVGAAARGRSVLLGCSGLCLGWFVCVLSHSVWVYSFN